MNTKQLNRLSNLQTLSALGYNLKSWDNPLFMHTLEQDPAEFAVAVGQAQARLDIDVYEMEAEMSAVNSLTKN